MFVQMLFGDEFIMVDRLDVHLFIWKQEGWCVDLLENSHSVVNVTIFMSAVKYMQCICRARVIVFNVPYVFPESNDLPNISFVAGLSRNFVYSTFFVFLQQGWCYGFYEIVQCCRSLERYAYIRIFNILVIFLMVIFFYHFFSFFVDFVQYLQVKFQQQVLRKVIVLSN